MFVQAFPQQPIYQQMRMPLWRYKTQLKYSAYVTFMLHKLCANTWQNCDAGYK